MAKANELESLGHRLWLWHAYDPSVKADLFSSAFETSAGLLFVDPIPLSDAALGELTGGRRVCGVVVTNINHVRAAESFAQKFGASVFASQSVLGEMRHRQTRPVEEITNPDLTIVAIDGAPEGEIALYLKGDGGTLIVGDALIHFEPYGFSLLPPKYCLDQNLMRRSLRRLLDLQFDRLLFAHGLPILSHARARLETLLGNER